MFDRFKSCKFYGEATLMGSRLTEAFDKEREKVAEKLGINKVEKALEWVTKVYGYKGKTFDEAVCVNTLGVVSFGEKNSSAFG